MFRTPTCLPFFLDQKREILHISTAYNSVIVLLGKRQPSPLKKLCSDVIRLNPDIFTINTTTATTTTHSNDERSEGKVGEKSHEYDINSQTNQLITTRSETFSNELKEFILSHIV